MEVPAKLRSTLVGIRYWLAALLFLATSTLLLSCSGGGSTVIVIAEDIGSIILTIEDDPLVAGGVDSTRVTAEVFNFDGVPVPDGTTVNFAVTPIGTVFATAYTKDGIAATMLTSDAAAGQYSLTVSAGNARQVAFGEFIPGPAAAANTSLTANPSTLPADGTSTALITLIAKDANGNPIADDTTVNFYTTAGTLSVATAPIANGVATTVLTSSAGNGVVANVTAVVDGLSTITTVSIGSVVGNATGTASYIELSISDFSIRVKDAGGHENSVITAVARDESGAPINDFADNIRFSIENGPNGGEELDGSSSSVTKSTTNGAASVSLTSGTVSGTVRIRVEAILDGAGSDVGSPFATALTTAIAVEAGEPANIIIFQDNLVVANNDGSISQTFSALAQDLHGNPVENGTVVFFGLVDNPDPAGPPYLGYKSAGSNGVTNQTAAFTSATNTFVTDGLMADDILIILEGQDEGGHRIQTVDNNTGLTLYNSLNGSETGLDFVAGSAELGTVCGSVQTGNLEMDSSCTPTTVGGLGSTKGVAHTTLTWVPQAIFKPFHLYAESVGGDVGNTRADSYSAVAPVTVTVTLAPSSVRSGTGGIFVEAEIKDGAGNRIEGQPIVFSSSDPGVAFISGPNPVVTGPSGKAATTIGTASCLTANASVTITAALGSFKGTGTLTVTATAPTANFTFTTAPEKATYTDTSTTPTGTTLSSWAWVFSGGSPSTNNTRIPPTVNYGSEGTYQTTLTVTNNLGCSSAPVSKAVTVPAAP